MKLRPNAKFWRNSDCLLSSGRIYSKFIIRLYLEFYVPTFPSAEILRAAELSPSSSVRPCSFSPSDQAETTMTSFNVNEARFEGHSPTLYTTPLHFLNATLYNSFFSFSTTLLWWDYSEGGSKYGSGCLNFDQGKKAQKGCHNVMGISL